MCHPTPLLSSSVPSLAGIAPMVLSALDVYLSGPDSDGLMIKDICHDERSNAIEIALRALQTKSGDPLIKRKSPDGFPSCSLVVQATETELRIGFVARSILDKGSSKRVKKMETVVFNTTSSSLSVVREVLAIRALNFEKNSATGLLELSTKIDRKSAIASQKELAFHQFFGGSSHVIGLKNRFERFNEEKLVRKVYQIHEEAPRGSLFKVLLKISPAERIAMAKIFLQNFAKIAHSFREFHARELYYVDFKSENILVLNPEHWVLGDLESLSKKEEYESHAESVTCTSFMAPPEYTASSATPSNPEKHEAWSLGMTIIETLGGGEIFDSLGIPVAGDKNPSESLARLDQATMDAVVEDITKKLPAGLQGPFRDLVLGLLKINPSDRISMDEAIARLAYISSNPELFERIAIPDLTEEFF